MCFPGVPLRYWSGGGWWGGWSSLNASFNRAAPLCHFILEAACGTLFQFCGYKLNVTGPNHFRSILLLYLECSSGTLVKEPKTFWWPNVFVQTHHGNPCTMSLQNGVPELHGGALSMSGMRPTSLAKVSAKIVHKSTIRPAHKGALTLSRAPYPSWSSSNLMQ